MVKGKIELTRKLQQIGDSLMLTIPKQLADLKGWGKGTEIIISQKEGDLILKKV